jgi:hypothetical protein
MPSSKKGRLSGGARKLLNDVRANQAVAGKTDGISFARVSRILGANHVDVSIACKHGIKTLRARIPNVLSRRGATPITTKNVVSIYVGNDFNPDEEIRQNSQFDITSILTDKQAHLLYKEGTIPSWMVHEDGAEAKKEELEGGFEWDYSDEPDALDEEAKRAERNRTNKRVQPIIEDDSGSDDDVDIDAI